jgi:hypothetical protein
VIVAVTKSSTSGVCVRLCLRLRAFFFEWITAVERSVFVVVAQFPAFPARVRGFQKATDHLVRATTEERSSDVGIVRSRTDSNEYRRHSVAPNTHSLQPETSQGAAAGTSSACGTVSVGHRHSNLYDDVVRWIRSASSLSVTCSSPPRHVRPRLSDIVRLQPRSPPSTMHNFRLRWVALGLLIYVQGAICRTSPLCPDADGDTFDDVPSRTVGARAVVEAVAQRVDQVPQTPGRLRVRMRFRVERILKADPSFPFQLPSLNATGGGRSNRSSLVTDVFGEAIFSGPTNEPETLSSSSSTCVRPSSPPMPEIKRRVSYVIFIGHGKPINASDNVIFKFRSQSSSDDGGSSHGSDSEVTLPISGFPLRVSKATTTDVMRFVSCSKCSK